MLVAPLSLLALLASQNGAFAEPDCGGVALDAAVADPFFELFVAVPQSGEVVPTNVAIRLSGPMRELDKEPPGIIPELTDAAGETVPVVRDGRIVRPAAPLQDNSTYHFQLVRTDNNDCPDCFSDVITFTTTTLDDEPPPAPGVERLDLTLTPIGCDFGQGNHLLRLQAALDVDAAFIEVLTVARDGIVTRTFSSRTWSPLDLTLAHRQDRLALDDELRVAITTTDFAGHRSPTRVYRVVARPAGAPYDDEAPRMCELPVAPAVHAPAPLPANGHIVVDYPFESVPLAIDLGDSVRPLAKDSLGPFRERLSPTAAAPAGTHALRNLDCPQCQCMGCQVPFSQSLEVLDVVDDTAPATPALLAVERREAPTLSGGPCDAAPFAGLNVLLAPGADDLTATADLSYHATISLDGDTPLLLGEHLRAEDLGDGTARLALDTRRYGDVLGHAIELSVRAVDAAGNSTPAVYIRGPDPVDDAGGGCRQTGAAALSPFALLGVLLWRRRVRSV